MIADRGDPQRLRAVDQHAEDAAATRQVADQAMRLGIDATRDEALELAAVTIEDPERGVVRAGDPTGGLQNPVEHSFWIELREQVASDVDQATQPLLVEVVVHGLQPVTAG